MNDDMLALAARVEALDGPQFQVEVEISDAIWQCKWGRRRPKDIKPENYTASIDAAITLIPTESFWRVGHDADDPAWMTAQVSYDRGEGRLGFTTGTAKTAAMALCAASLRARASMGGE